MQDLAQQLTGAGPTSVFLAAFLGPYVFPAAGELAMVAAIGLGLDPFTVFALGLVGSVASDQFGYGIGRVGGTPIVNRMLLPDRREVLEQRMHRHAVVALVPGRMLPGARTWIAILAGIARLPWRRFAVLNFAGCVLWSVVLVVVGVVFGATVDVEGLVEAIRHWQLQIFLGVSMLFISRMVYVRHQRRRRA